MSAVDRDAEAPTTPPNGPSAQSVVRIAPDAG